jgi:hypothetical protein
MHRLNCFQLSEKEIKVLYYDKRFKWKLDLDYSQLMVTKNKLVGLTIYDWSFKQQS